MERQTLLTNKITLLIDDMWFQELLTKMMPFAEGDEILQLVDKTDVELCDGCRTYLTLDDEVIMDVFRCDAQKEYCLNCCGCEEHAGEAWY